MISMLSLYTVAHILKLFSKIIYFIIFYTLIVCQAADMPIDPFIRLPGTKTLCVIKENSRKY